MCQKYHINKSRAVMVGDRYIDILAGRNAKIDAVLFNPDGLGDKIESLKKVSNLRKLIDE